jgi:hypothetical protein
VGKAFHVQRESLVVRAESRSIKQLWPLIHPKAVTRVLPHATDAPVVLRSDDVEYLLDGRRRINYWSRHNQAGPHRVLDLFAEGPVAI